MFAFTNSRAKTEKIKRLTKDMPDGVKAVVRKIIHDINNDGKHVTHISKVSLDRLLKIIRFE